jgi:flagellar hook-associated protein 1 FlgK
VRVNGIITEVAELDRAIVSALAAGDTASGLLDQRDTLTTELAGLVDVRVTYELDGQSRVTLDGHSLVADGQASLLQMTTVPDAGLAALGYDRPALATLGGRVISLDGGSIHGHLQVANELVPEQRRGLDAVATSIATTVNALHAAGAGLDGSTGNNLFDPAGLTASSFAVSADVLGQPSKIAASNGSGVLDNSVALALASLGTAENGPAAAHADFITSLGTRVQTLMSRSQAAELTAARAVANERADTGVSLDEELADLVSAQRAYEASARMITTIDQMLDTLINRTGLVGR